MPALPVGPSWAALSPNQMCEKWWILPIELFKDQQAPQESSLPEPCCIKELGHPQGWPNSLRAGEVREKDS